MRGGWCRRGPCVESCRRRGRVHPVWGRGQKNTKHCDLECQGGGGERGVGSIGGG